MDQEPKVTVHPGLMLFPLRPNYSIITGNKTKSYLDNVTGSVTLPPTSKTVCRGIGEGKVST